MPSRIPKPEFLHESLEGALYTLPGGTLLIPGRPPAAIGDNAPIISGTIIFRYGISFLIPPQDALIPGLFVSERGAALTGREAWDFMLAHCQLYPRADVLGFRTNGGDSQVFLKQLDWGRAVRVLAYASLDNRMPAAEPAAMFIGEDAPPIPELLAKYLAVVSDLTAFMTSPE